MVPDGEDENDPYVRWQGFRITQLGFCIGLFLTFSVATLGFAANLLVQPSYEITACFAKTLFFLSGISGLFSIICGSVACLTRLADFRTTARVARHREDPTKVADVKCWRETYKWWGRCTWALFRGQLALFGLQGISLILSLVTAYWPRLK